MYAKMGLVSVASQVFDEVQERNVVMYNTMITGLLRCGMVKDSKRLFHGMKERDSISWTTMITGLIQNGLEAEAMDLFRDMRQEGMAMDQYTFGSVLTACGGLMALKEGKEIHTLIIRSGYNHNVFVGSALVDMYCKCGSIEDSNQLFDEMSFRDEVSWTALVSGYAQFGKANETIDLFEKMLVQGLKPDAVTFIAVLSACSRAGLVERGQQYFESMLKDHGIIPFSDHYTCMIDLFGRAGRLEEAKNFINKMPFSPDSIGWATLLSSCRLYGNEEIGKWAAESLLELDPQNPAGYILLSSIYAAKGKWSNVAQLRRGMREKGARKEPGFSWIKYKSKVYIFSADDQSSPFLIRYMLSWRN
ncbi:pentatricopeptide repeat-containing protein [Populus alba x Populus x berolinensis]|nr:pentatricopeptide repeat-containing protein [Populus alba x Populus x berolinensis]